MLLNIPRLQTKTLSVYLSVCLSTRLSVALSVYLSVCLSTCLSVCLFVCLSILSVCLSKSSLSLSDVLAARHWRCCPQNLLLHSCITFSSFLMVTEQEGRSRRSSPAEPLVLMTRGRRCAAGCDQLLLTLCLNTDDP